jgi:CheY-like chemotaxis protein
MIRSGLDISGYVVLEAANVEEAIHCLEHQQVRVVLAALNLSPGSGSALLTAMRRQPDWVRIPVLAVADSVEEIEKSQWQAHGFQDCQTKFDSSAILEAVTRLVSAAASDELECVEAVR